MEFLITIQIFQIALLLIMALVKRGMSVYIKSDRSKVVEVNGCNGTKS